jgi:hypothetical protein
MLNLQGELDRLFHPISPRAFFSRYWERRSLLIPGDRDKFAHLGFSSDTLYRIGRHAASTQACKAWVAMQREISIDPRSIKRHYNAGRSICMSDIQLDHEPLRQVVAALKSVLGLAHQIGFACYLSPRQQGIPLHCDRHDVFILQIEGEKQWQYARTAATRFPVAATRPADPTSIEQFAELHGRDRTRVPRARDLVCSVLRPGDLLYLPAGTFHATLAAKHSLSLTLGCTPRPVASIIGKAIERAFRDRPEWRQNPPPIAASEPGSARAIERLLRGRMRDLSRWLASADVEDFAAVWRSHVADFRWEPPVRTHPDPVGPETRLVRVWPIATSRRSAGPLEVMAANRIFTVPRRHQRLIAGLASHARFSADDTRRWGGCSWPTARSFVELMLHHGIVERAEPE